MHPRAALAMAIEDIDGAGHLADQLERLLGSDNYQQLHLISSIHAQLELAKLHLKNVVELMKPLLDAAE